MDRYGTFRGWRAVVAVMLIVISSTGTAAVALQGEAAPNFTLRSNAGENLRLSEYRGQVVMLNFWATWCKPCRQEIPYLNALHRDYENLGFTVLGVNLDQQSRRAVSLMSELEASYPTLFDANKAVSKRYRVDAMPTTVLIDRDGDIRHIQRGYKPEYIEKYHAQVRGLLRE